MKIALFLQQFPVRSETFILRQAKGLLAAGHDLHILASLDGEEWADDGDKLLFKDRVHVLPVSARDITIGNLKAVLFEGLTKAHGRRRLKLLFDALRDRRISLAKQLVATGGVDMGEFDAVLAHFGPTGVKALAMREAGVFSGPLGTVFHGFDMSITDVIGANRKGYARLFLSGDRMFPISDAWKNRLVSWGCDPRKISVMRMGVDLANYESQMVVDDRPDRALRIVTVGRLVEKKGIEDAIEGILRSETEANLRIVGSGPLEDHLRTVAGGSPHVTFLGALPHDRVLDEIEAADIFLLPSVTATNGDMEGIPVSLMEAMALGTVVIATDHSGNSELIENGVSGFLVPEHRPDDIAALLRRLYSGGYDLAEIKAAARSKIARDFNNALLDVELVEHLQAMGASHRA